MGCCRGAFRPDDEICVLRSYLRQREMLITCAAAHIQHMQKALQQMNLKLSNVLTDITGQTGMLIIQAILDGERDPVKLAQYRDPRCKQPEEIIAKSLVGNWRDDHLFELKQAVELVRFYQQQLRECDARIEIHLRQLPDRRGPDSPPLPARNVKLNSHTPGFDARGLLHRTTGVDLTSIHGIAANTALKLVSEIGRDMSRWPGVQQFCSWLCPGQKLNLCPGNKKTGGKVFNTRTRRSQNRAAAALRMAAPSLERSKTALGAYYRRMKSRLGAPEAITAAAHKLARIVYSLLKHGQSCRDLGQDAYEQQYRDRMQHSLERRAKQLGFQLVPIATPV